MWVTEKITGTLHGDAFLIRNKLTGGYLADNSTGGGAIHFGIEDEAETVCDILNSYYTH